MASAAIQAAVEAFLATDVRSTVNAEQTGLLVSGSVVVARPATGRAPRVQSAYPVSVEIVKASPWASRATGVGLEELDLVYDLKLEVRRKDLPRGANQVALVGNMARALVRRYRDASNLSLTVTGATFRYSDATDQAADEVPDSAELVRACVRATLTFTEDLAANT